MPLWGRSRNLFSIYIPPVDQLYTPLRDKSQKDKDLRILQNEFAHFMADKLKEKLQRAIETQRYIRSWPPLDELYLKRKQKEGLSTNIWEATSLLKDSIRVWKQGDIFIVGIPDYVKYRRSRKDGTIVEYKVASIARILEMGNDRIPPRPLFLPVLKELKRNMPKYLEEFIAEYGWTRWKLRRKRRYYGSDTSYNSPLDVIESIEMEGEED